MLDMAHLTNGGITILENQPDLSGRKFDMGVLPLLRHQLTRSPRTTDDLSAFSYLQFDVVDEGPRWNIAKREGIARLDVGCGACDHFIPYLDLGRGQNISFLSVGIVEQSDSRRPIRIVLNGSHLGGNLFLVPLEINEAILPLMTSSPVPGCNPSMAVSAPPLLQRDEKALLGSRRSYLLECGNRLEPFCRRSWFIALDAHPLTPYLTFACRRQGF